MTHAAQGLKGSRHKARCSALQALYQWQVTRQLSSEIESHFLADNVLDGADLDYFQHLVSEIPANLTTLDDRLAAYVDRDIGDIDPVERAILRLGAFELEFHPEIPYRVILNEAVELAKTYGAEQGHKYINAVLDRLALTLRAAEVTNSSTPDPISHSSASPQKRGE